MKKNKLIVLMSVISALILSVSLFTVGTAAEGETPSFTTVEAAGKYMREELISIIIFIFSNNVWPFYYNKPTKAKPLRKLYILCLPNLMQTHFNFQIGATLATSI